MKGRSYFVSVNQKKSTNYPILSVVPQGSCLSSTLFNLYFSDTTKDLPININNALFADDLSILSTKKSLTESKNHLKNSIQKITEFRLRWGLTLNKAKTVYTVFTTARYRNSYEKINSIKLEIDNTRIPLEPYPRFLGIFLDPKLSFERHFNLIIGTTIAIINFIKKIKNLKWQNTIKFSLIISKSTARSTLDYASTAFSTYTQKILSKCEKLHTRIIKIIKHFPLKTRTTTILERLSIISFQERTNKIFAFNDNLITQEINQYNSSISVNITKRFKTLFDLFQPPSLVKWTFSYSP